MVSYFVGGEEKICATRANGCCYRFILPSDSSQSNSATAAHISTVLHHPQGAGGENASTPSNRH
ncbi:MAG: hypothetical protein IJW19_00095 [Clostridia bacterium]|nr:hypothetical protein [Clostridia bacterium]